MQWQNSAAFSSLLQYIRLSWKYSLCVYYPCASRHICLFSVKYRRHGSSHLPPFDCVNRVPPVLDQFSPSASYPCLFALTGPFLPLGKHPWFNDLKTVSDLASCSGGQKARLCVSLNHSANSVGKDTAEKSSRGDMWEVKLYSSHSKWGFKLQKFIWRVDSGWWVCLERKRFQLNHACNCSLTKN